MPSTNSAPHRTLLPNQPPPCSRCAFVAQPPTQECMSMLEPDPVGLFDKMLAFVEANLSMPEKDLEGSVHCLCLLLRRCPIDAVDGAVNKLCGILSSSNARPPLHLKMCATVSAASSKRCSKQEKSTHANSAPDFASPCTGDSPRAALSQHGEHLHDVRLPSGGPLHTFYGDARLRRPLDDTSGSHPQGRAEPEADQDRDPRRCPSSATTQRHRPTKQTRTAKGRGSSERRRHR